MTQGTAGFMPAWNPLQGVSEYELQTMNGNVNRAFQSESVPLSNAMEEEWGWEEGGFEDTNKNNLHMQKQKEEEDLQMAMAMSLSSKDTKQTNTNSNGDTTTTTTASKSSSLKKNSPPVSSSRKTVSTISAGPKNKLSSSNKLSQQPKKPVVAAAASKDKDVDDIFASMGFAAKPTFSQNGGAQPQRTSFQGADEDSSLGSNSNWDDDDDLDDLLAD